jgi:hypothetical protein
MHGSKRVHDPFTIESHGTSLDGYHRFIICLELLEERTKAIFDCRIALAISEVKQKSSDALIISTSMAEARTVYSLTGVKLPSPPPTYVGLQYTKGVQEGSSPIQL